MKFDHFGLIAPLYDRTVKLRVPQALLDLLGPGAGGWALDIGGGTGQIAQFLQAGSEGVVVGDVSLPMLRLVSKKPGLDALLGESEGLPFADNTFERIIMVDALHHVTSQQRTARELFRVLRPGGRLVIEEPDIRRFAVKLIALGEKVLLMRSHFLKQEHMQALFDGLPARVRSQSAGHMVWVIVEK